LAEISDDIALARSTSEMQNVPPIFGQDAGIRTFSKQVEQTGFGAHRSQMKDRNSVSILGIDVDTFLTSI
jgi:hypothetical protein